MSQARQRAKELRRKERKARDAAKSDARRAARENRALREIMERELASPETLARCLARLGDLVSDGVVELELPTERLGDLLFAARPAADEATLPPGERAWTHLGRVIGGLADKGFGKTILRELARASEDVEGDPADGAALTTARLLLSAWLDGTGRAHENPVWHFVHDLTVRTFVASGRLAQRCLSEERALDDAGVDALARRFEAALDRPPLVGLDPRALARRYAAIVRDTEWSSAVGADAVLHLARSWGRFAEDRLKEVRLFGLTPDLRRAALTTVDEAYRADFTPAVLSELERSTEAMSALAEGDVLCAKGVSPTVVAALMDGKVRAQTYLASMRVLAPEENAALRMLHVTSLEHLVNKELDEQALVEKVLIEPEDAWGLAELERLLDARGERARAERVRQFRSALERDAAIDSPA